MTEKFFAEQMYEQGFTDLVSVIPPGAQLVPTSKIAQSAVGKIPGRRGPSGLWAGYNWRTHEPTIDDVRKWCVDNANIGLRAGRFPAVDIDCTDATIAQMIEDAALAYLGPAPVRIGRAPKRLLMYRTTEPFGRMRLVISSLTGESHLVELLGAGQQFLVHGIHPATGRAYEWVTSPLERELTTITREQVDTFFGHIEQLVDMIGYGTVKRIGDGRKTENVPAADQQALRAPSLEILRDCVALIPNDDSTAPTRDEYIRIGYAIRAAAGEVDADEGFSIFAEWAAKHVSDGRVAGNSETWLGDWRRMNAPYSVGFSFLAGLARPHGFNDAALEFDASEAPVSAETDARAPLYSEQWLAQAIVDRQRGILRYVPQKGCWLVWESARWRIDAELQAEDVIKRTLREIADKVMRQGVTPKEKKDALDLAIRICSAGKAQAVAQLLRSDRAIAVSIASLDHNPWVLNTPQGIVDLTTGQLHAPDPDALCSKSTAVPPDFSGACPEWKRFLAEATGGDVELERYLQRLAGYALTGSTREQHLTFMHGGGGNGKSVFMNVLTGILGDYARTAPMDTFTASSSDRHSTELAMLHGARLVTASETEAGKRWDEARVKSLTGGEPVSARFMRQDFFTFRPQFKLLFVGNHRPEVRDVGEAMRRRIQMVPFNVTPAQVDRDLGEKLEQGWPAILAWMIAGCRMWQLEGLSPPAVVRAATDEYFDSEDAVGRWMRERVELAADGTATTGALYDSWVEWAGANREFVGKPKGLASALVARNLPRWQEPGTRRMGFAGIRLKDRQCVELMA